MKLHRRPHKPTGVLVHRRMADGAWADIPVTLTYDHYDDACGEHVWNTDITAFPGDEISIETFPPHTSIAWAHNVDPRQEATE